MHDLATLFARHIKDLFVRKLIQTGHSDLLKKLDGCTPPQAFFKTIQSYFRIVYPNKLFLHDTKNNVSKEIPNTGKYSGRRSLLEKL